MGSSSRIGLVKPRDEPFFTNRAASCKDRTFSLIVTLPVKYDYLNLITILFPLLCQGLHPSFHLPLEPLPGKEEQLYDKNLVWDGLNIQKRGQLLKNNRPQDR
ncbi:MAG: hypothetical protein A2169_03690 [Deltaproteobacteria bacterium RBG_13_47_9]|nr:MAG: hypothetical protein A2169_03690 [Deltaproteobacteria bacterium RBG_13_47_9]